LLCIHAKQINQVIEDPFQKKESVRMIHESDIASKDRTNNCPRWGGFVVSVMQKTKSRMYLYWVELFTVTANLYNIAFLHTLNK